MRLFGSSSHSPEETIGPSSYWGMSRWQPRSGTRTANNACGMRERQNRADSITGWQYAPFGFAVLDFQNEGSITVRCIGETGTLKALSRSIDQARPDTLRLVIQERHLRPVARRGRHGAGRRFEQDFEKGLSRALSSVNS